VNLAPALLAHAPAMAAAHAAAFDTAWTAEDIADLLGGPGGFGFIVEEAAEIAGFILCRALGDEAEVLTLAVRPSHRREGVAKALLQAAEDAASLGGASAVFLEVAADNAPAIALYVSGGFHEVGRRAGYYGRGAAPAADALVMRRDLNR
jgi:ribosomal-protein-alanine N-acetyltransferase